MKAIKSFISLVVSNLVSLPFLRKKWFKSSKYLNKKVKDSKLNIISLLEGSATSVNLRSDLFLFDNLGNVDVTTSTHWASSRFHFAYIYPFMSTLQTYPLCHISQLHSNLYLH
jgi:hypothetical protein